MVESRLITSDEDLRELVATRLCSAMTGFLEPSTREEIAKHVEGCAWCKEYIKQKKENEKNSISEVCCGCQRYFSQCICRELRER